MLESSRSPLPRRRLGRTGLEVSVLGFGSAPIGDLYAILDESQAVEAVEIALKSGVNLIDTSPFYGAGLAESRIGTALRRVPEVSAHLCTKVGRHADPFSLPTDRSGFEGGLPHALTLDYSYDGVMRSLEQSLLRLGLHSIDIVLIHDIDRWTHGEKMEQYYREAMEGAVPALTKLREEGTIKGFGIGLNEADIAARFSREADLDVVLLAGRYSLLEQPAMEEFLPLAESRDIGVILGGVFNSGILATGAVEGARYNYGEAPDHIMERVIAIESVCRRHNIPLRQAALHFVFGHPAISCVVLGSVADEEVRMQVEDFHASIPPDLWQELRGEGLLGEKTPTP